MRALIVAAIAFASSAAHADRKQAKPHLDAGTAHYQAARYAEAIASFERAFELDPDAQTLFALANAYFRNKDYKRAVEYAQRYVAADPGGKNVDAALALAEAATKASTEADGERRKLEEERKALEEERRKLEEERKRIAAERAGQPSSDPQAAALVRRLDQERARLVTAEAARLASATVSPERGASLGATGTPPAEGTPDSPTPPQPGRAKAVFGLQLGQHLPIYTGDAFGQDASQKTKPGGSAALFVDIRIARTASLRVRGQFEYSNLELEVCDPCRRVGDIELFSQAADLLIRLESLPRLVPYAGVGLLHLAGASKPEMGMDEGISGFAPRLIFGGALQFAVGSGQLSIDVSTTWASTNINGQANVGGYRTLGMMLGYAFGR